MVSIRIRVGVRVRLMAKFNAGIRIKDKVGVSFRFSVLVGLRLVCW